MLCLLQLCVGKFCFVFDFLPCAVMTQARGFPEQGVDFDMLHRRALWWKAGGSGWDGFAGPQM